MPTLDGRERELRRVRASGVTAVVAYDDLMAIGLLRACRCAAVDMPWRLSIIGFDDIFGSDFTSPPITTIRTPLEHSVGNRFPIHRDLEIIRLMAASPAGLMEPRPSMSCR